MLHISKRITEDVYFCEIIYILFFIFLERQLWLLRLCLVSSVVLCCVYEDWRCSVVNIWDTDYHGEEVVFDFIVFERSI